MKTGSTLLLLSIQFLGFGTRSAYTGGSILPNLYWNTSNPIFLISNTDHIIDVNKATTAQQHDRINIVCPKYDNSSSDQRLERHVIYNVNKEEYETCRILNTPRIIAMCDAPLENRIFTISFRSFSPNPTAIEYHPGKSYYFISTASDEDMGSRDGGYCRSNNMKVVFKVAERFKKESKVKKVVNSQAKAVKWKENKQTHMSTGENVKAPKVIKESQSILDRQFIKKDKMLSDEQSNRYFYAEKSRNDQLKAFIVKTNVAKESPSLLDSLGSRATLSTSPMTHAVVLIQSSLLIWKL